MLVTMLYRKPYDARSCTILRVMNLKATTKVCFVHSCCVRAYRVAGEVACCDPASVLDVSQQPVCIPPRPFLDRTDAGGLREIRRI